MSVEPGSFEDMVQAGALLAGVSFIIVWGVSAFLSRFVALKSLPDRRALWTVVPGILIAIGVCEPMAMGVEMPIYVVFFILLPGLAIFWWYRREYRHAWIPDDQIPDGLKLENDDWQVGVAGILLLVVVGLFRYFLRTL